MLVRAPRRASRRRSSASPTRVYGEVPHAFVVGEVGAEELRAFADERLARFKVPGGVRLRRRSSRARRAGRCSSASCGRRRPGRLDRSWDRAQPLADAWHQRGSPERGVATDGPIPQSRHDRPRWANAVALASQPSRSCALWRAAVREARREYAIAVPEPCVDEQHLAQQRRVDVPAAKVGGRIGVEAVDVVGSEVHVVCRRPPPARTVSSCRRRVCPVDSSDEAGEAVVQVPLEPLSQQG